ncbi:WYL domain-containing protein [bacterium]|nr:WYL domain-containing protein [bacterium]
MARNLRLRRLLHLVSLLQSGLPLNPDALAERLSISRRTVFRDLQELNSAGLTVLYDDQRQGYFLPVPWRLPVEKLTVSEAVSLLLICQEMGRAEGGMPFHAAAQSAALKISRSLPVDLQEFAQDAVDAMAIRLEPTNPLASSAECFEQLQEAWMQRRPVRIAYESASERREISTILNPYRLFFSRRSWYVIGRSSADRAIRVYNIGRIINLQMLDSSYRIPKGFSLDKHLGDAWHLIREPQNRHRIVIHFSPLVARNVSEVRWHKSQVCRWLPDGTLEYQVTVDGLTEITWWILGYGDHATVIEPDILRRQIQQRIERMRSLYQSPQTRE